MRKSRNRIRIVRAIAEAMESRTLLSNVPFVQQTPFSTSAAQAHSTVPVDLDGDGDIDVVTASIADNTVSWFANNGSGSFTGHTISTTATGARTAFAIDLDKDGDVDVLVAGQDGNLLWFENSGAETFTSHNITTGNPGSNDVSVADVNGDNNLDVIADDTASGSVIWYQNDGNENFTPHTINSGLGVVKDTTAIDLDKDGDVDILTAEPFVAPSDQGKIAWYENNGLGVFTLRGIDAVTTSSFSVDAADLDGDGDLDVIGASNVDDTVQWYENNGSESFTKHLLSSSIDGAMRVFPADLDADGDIDVLCCGFAGDKVVWFENLGGGSFTTGHNIDLSLNQAVDVAAADLDADGDLDVTAASFQDNKLTWYQNTGGRLKVDAVSTAPAAMGNGSTASLLTLNAQHIGQAGDNPDRLSSLGVTFLSGSSSTPLSSAQASALIGTLSIYRDANANGTFDAVSDTLVATTSALSLDGSGTQAFTFGASDVNAQFGPGASATLFVVATTTADAASQSPNSFRVASGTSAGADRVTSRVLVNVAGTGATTAPIAAAGTSPPPSPPPPPPGTSTLAVVAEAALPAVAVSGEKAKGSVRVTVTNTTADVFNGTVAINVFSSTDTTLDGGDLVTIPAVQKKLKIKAGREKAIKLKLRGFPAGLADGTYRLLAQVTPPDGIVTVAPTDATTAVQAPFINLSGQNVAPVEMVPGKRAKLKVIALNTGNVLLSGTVSVVVRAVPVGQPIENGRDLATFPTVKLKLKPNRTKGLSLKFEVPTDLAAGSYTLVATLDSTNVLPESNEADNVATSATATNVAVPVS